MSIHTQETEIVSIQSPDFEPIYSYQELLDRQAELERRLERIERQPRYQVFQFEPVQTYQEYNNWVEAGIHKTLNFLRW